MAHAFVVPTVASSVDLVVDVMTDGQGHRRGPEIVGVPGRIEGDVVETSQIFQTAGGQLVRSHGFPPHPERYERTGADLAALLSVPAWSGGR